MKAKSRVCLHWRCLGKCQVLADVFALSVFHAHTISEVLCYTDCGWQGKVQSGDETETEQCRCVSIVKASLRRKKIRKWRSRECRGKPKRNNLLVKRSGVACAGRSPYNILFFFSYSLLFEEKPSQLEQDFALAKNPPGGEVRFGPTNTLEPMKAG